jgi:hypothetical protein
LQGSQSNSVSIVTRLRAGRVGFDPKQERRTNFTSLQRHPDRLCDPSILLSSGYQGLKRPQREAYQSPSSSTEVENAWRYTSTCPYVFMSRLLLQEFVITIDMVQDMAERRFVVAEMNICFLKLSRVLILL